MDDKPDEPKSKEMDIGWRFWLAGVLIIMGVLPMLPDPDIDLLHYNLYGPTISGLSGHILTTIGYAILTLPLVWTHPHVHKIIEKCNGEDAPALAGDDFSRFIIVLIAIRKNPDIRYSAILFAGECLYVFGLISLIYWWLNR